MPHENDNIQYKVVAATAASLIIANIGVILRLISRRVKKLSLQGDDYLIIVALVGNILPMMKDILTVSSFSNGESLSPMSSVGSYSLVKKQLADNTQSSETDLVDI
jgi:hypothetical protein